MSLRSLQHAFRRVVCLGGFLLPGLAAASIEIGPSSRTWGSNREGFSTAYFEVASSPAFWTSVDEHHAEYYYPTSTDYRPAGYFSIDPHNAVVADFDGDGREDVMVVWAIFPHTVDRSFLVSPMILRNEGGGALRIAPELFSGPPPAPFFGYRSGKADFNGDGRPDVVIATMGKVERLPEGGFRNAFEPIVLMLSTPDGRLRDASGQIEGQESGGLPAGYTFGHELSVGDVDGDGDADFFTGKCLFLNDGTGRFTQASALLPEAIRPPSTYLMTSIIADLNRDGIGDIVSAYADGAPGSPSGYVLLSQGGSASFANRQVVALPAGRYGQGVTKFNHGTAFDVEGDGWTDLVFSVTRANPYYQGRGLQVLRNVGGQAFVDQTATRVVETPALDAAQGEGSLRVVDVNGDGLADLVHSGSTAYQETEPHGMTVFLNAGGVLHAASPEWFAFVQPWQLDGAEGLRPWQTRAGMGRSILLDLDGRSGLDYLSLVTVPLLAWPQVEPSSQVFYTVLAKVPLPTPLPGAADLRWIATEPTTGAPRLRFRRGSPGVSAMVESSPDLRTWNGVELLDQAQTGQSWGEQTFEVSVPPPSGTRVFYRIRTER